MPQPFNVPRAEALAGVLLGTALGDSLGLPMEGLSAARQRRLFPPPLRQRLLGARGLVSDDTEHTFMVAQALLAHPRDAAAFQRSLAWKLRWWLVSLPAGVGFATLRAILKLWVGVPPSHSGIFSAGNGPAMRSAILGVYFAEDSVRRAAFVGASSQLTHRDPRAEIAALAVAECASWMVQSNGAIDVLLERLAKLDREPEWSGLMAKLRTGLEAGGSVAAFAAQIGATRGVSGYAYQSVPVALYAALLHRDDFTRAITAVIECGGDTDTVGAITGALVGARLGETGLPKAWIDGLAEWPRSVPVLRQLADRLAAQAASSVPLGPVSYAWLAIPMRNVFFLAIVLAHGFRRLLPPY